MDGMRVILISAKPGSGKSALAMKIAELNGFHETVYFRDENNVFFPDSFQMAEKMFAVPFPPIYSDTFSHDIALRDMLIFASSVEKFTLAIIETTTSSVLHYIISDIFKSALPLTAIVSDEAWGTISLKQAIENPQKILELEDEIEEFRYSGRENIRNSFVIEGEGFKNKNPFGDIPCRVFRLSDDTAVLDGKPLGGQWNTLPAKLIMPHDLEHEGFPDDGFEGRDYSLSFSTAIEVFLDPDDIDYLQKMISIGETIFRLNTGNALDPRGMEQSEVSAQISQMIEDGYPQVALALALSSLSVYGNSAAWEDMARCFSSMDCYRETMFFLRLAGRAGDESSLKNLFRVTLAWSKAQDASEFVNTMAAFDTDDTNYLLAKYYHEMLNWEECEKYLDKIIEISDDNYYDTLLIRSDIYMMTGRTEKAVEIRREMLEMFPDDDGVLYLLGIALIQDFKWEEALGVLKNALDMGNDFPPNLITLALCLKMTGEEGAEELIEEALDSATEDYSDNPEYTVFIENMILALMAVGQCEEADAIYESNRNKLFSTDFLVLKERIYDPLKI